MPFKMVQHLHLVWLAENEGISWNSISISPVVWWAQCSIVQRFLETSSGFVVWMLSNWFLIHSRRCSLILLFYWKQKPREKQNKKRSKTCKARSLTAIDDNKQTIENRLISYLCCERVWILTNMWMMTSANDVHQACQISCIGGQLIEAKKNSVTS